jgi:hypothetical protein
MTRQDIYKQVNKGNLTKNSDGKIDLAEAIRVFGEPSQHVNHLQTTATPKLSEVHLLEQQVHILQKQLELAQEREEFQREELKAKNEQIESLQRLLSAPKPQQEPQNEITQEPVPELIQQSIPEPVKSQLQPKPIVQESQQEPQKRRSLFSRVIRAVLD